MSATTSPRVRRVEGIVPERRLLGTVLLIIGGIVAAGFVVDSVDQYTLVAVSATLLVAFGLSREYGYAVPAGVTGGLGTAIDVPLGHKDAAFVRSHFDAIEARVSDAPRPNEIVVAVAVTDSGRPLARVGGLQKNEIKGQDGLR